MQPRTPRASGGTVGRKPETADGPPDHDGDMPSGTLPAGAGRPPRESGSARPRSGSAARIQAGNTGRTTRILLIEDDRLLAEAVSRMLEMAGFTAYVAGLGEDALDLVRAYRFDLILLDLTLPDMAGQTVLIRLRQMRPDVPVIILSGEADVNVKIEGLLDGADDYVTKPFNRDELLARIHAMLRRARATAPSELLIGDLVLDLSAHRAIMHGKPVPLTGKEYACLEFLALRRGMTVTKEMFLAHLYAGRDEPEMKIIDVFICKLRRKLTESGSPPIIETVWGRGYTIANDGGATGED